MLVDFDQSLITCDASELVLMIGQPDTMACHGIFTFRKVINIEDKKELMINRKRRVPSETVMAKRKEKRIECAHCDYASSAQFFTAHQVARIHLKSIPPTESKLCDFNSQAPS